MNSVSSPIDRATPSKTNWPLWRIVLAYAILLVVAFTSIWVIDRRVDALAEQQSGPQATR
jgi:type II secretory pathway component PulL